MTLEAWSCAAMARHCPSSPMVLKSVSKMTLGGLLPSAGRAATECDKDSRVRTNDGNNMVNIKSIFFV